MVSTEAAGHGARCSDAPRPGSIPRTCAIWAACSSACRARPGRSSSAALALSGFPIVTAGFWSKDEILADAFVNGHTLVFVTLAVAALLTAFYTARQIVMTFFGQPRTEAAEHASERDSIFAWMTIPLMVLARVRQSSAGWVGIPETSRSWARSRATRSTTSSAAWPRRWRSRPPSCPSHLSPLLTSLVVALGGLLLGWLVYRGSARMGATRPGRPADPDPMARPWAGLHGAAEQVLLRRAVSRRVRHRAPCACRTGSSASTICGSSIRSWMGSAARALVLEIGRRVRHRIVDGVVNGVGAVTDGLGGAVRGIQTGRVQNYLLVGLVTVSVLLARSCCCRSSVGPDVMPHPNLSEELFHE